MVRNSRPTTVPKNEEIDHELIEKRFKKLIQETKNKELKAWLKGVSDLFKPDDYHLTKDLIKVTRGVILQMTITICDLAKQLKETRIKLKECQERASPTPKLTE
jgi:hypothetical protein